jgi:hypothetical protein
MLLKFTCRQLSNSAANLLPLHNLAAQFRKLLAQLLFSFVPRIMLDFYRIPKILAKIFLPNRSLYCIVVWSVLVFCFLRLSLQQRKNLSCKPLLRVVIVEKFYKGLQEAVG